MKKVILTTLILLAAMFCAAQTNPYQHPGQTTTCGDANCDGSINVLDIIALINHIMNVNPQPFCPQVADINSDGSINVLDVIGTINIITLLVR